MQPNQQQNSQQNTQPPTSNDGSSGLPFDVPDYLGLKSTVTNKNRISNRRKVILLWLSTMVAVLIGTIGYFWWQYNSSEAIFYRALENSLRTKFVKREYSFKSNDPKSSLAISANTDFSDTARPKSKILYASEAPAKALGGTPDSYKGEIIVTTGTEFVASLNIAPDGFLRNSAEKGKFYKIANQDTKTKTTTAATFDYLKIRYLVNTTYDTIPVGNFTDTQVKDLLRSIQAGKVYKFKNVTDETLDTIRTKKYSIALDYAELNKIQKKISTTLNINTSNILFSNDSEEMTLWIDVSSTRIIKTSQNFVAKQTQLLEVKYGYPGNLKIEYPENVVPLL